MNHLSPPSQEEDRPSKSQRKRDVEALQVVGEQLAQLPERVLSNLSLDEKLYDTLMAVRHITQRGARKRQLQYVGKLMRHVDEETLAAILNCLREAQMAVPLDVVPVVKVKPDDA